MNEPFYEFTILDEAHRFDFVSLGRTTIAKSIIYLGTDIPKLYSLTLADIDSDGTPNVYSVSNNGDMEIIISTVYQSIVNFLKQNPDAVVGFQGSTRARTRLYQICIARQLFNLLEEFQVFGVQSTTAAPEPFIKGKAYDYFLICLKNRKFE